MQKGMEFINNTNIKEDCLGKKKLHLGQRGKCFCKISVKVYKQRRLNQFFV